MSKEEEKKRLKEKYCKNIIDFMMVFKKVAVIKIYNTRMGAGK